MSTSLIDNLDLVMSIVNGKKEDVTVQSLTAAKAEKERLIRTGDAFVNKIGILFGRAESPAFKTNYFRHRPCSFGDRFKIYT